MGNKTILKKHHKEFLALVLKEPYLIKRFYWTGGTVISEFYLHHRESEDIDLFSENQEIHLPSINKFISIAGKKLKDKEITHRQYLGLHTYIFKLPGVDLKVDFNYYPFQRLNKNKKWRGLEIDSLKDIAVNKIQTISTKQRKRDFVDLYFILKKEKWDLKDLVISAKTKFDWHIDPIQLGQTFAQVVTLEDVPRMLKPFDKKKMHDFFLEKARELENKIFK